MTALISDFPLSITAHEGIGETRMFLEHTELQPPIPDGDALRRPQVQIKLLDTAQYVFVDEVVDFTTKPPEATHLVILYMEYEVMAYVPAPLRDGAVSVNKPVKASVYKRLEARFARMDGLLVKCIAPAQFIVQKDTAPLTNATNNLPWWRD